MPERKTLLITGSEGTIGLVLAQALASDFNIKTLDRKRRGDERTHFTVDLADMESLQQVISNIQPIDFAIHLAANPDPAAPWEDILRNNITATRNLYECAKIFNIGRIVFASSTHLQGAYEGYPQTSPSGRPLTIADPPRPDSYYGISKSFGELLARKFYDLHSITTICLRIGSVFPDDQPFHPWDRIWLSHQDLVQVFLKALKSPIPFGIYYATSEIEGNPFDLEPTKKDLNYSPQSRLSPPDGAR
ncbi:hypothetical protein A2617_02325 [Candidatus Daviesbacteria bacterium RIFOXYD1_FULL_41_10]|uniref:NAD-dependent epimerase/dehydratase domain-containing protein n=3 Tax=Bacteria candidate phyla TaxID=1783234 RepID=A0A0G0IR42_9BACT|nr:MAG: hypothetical protein US31_C0004G0063 [Berkelbacteria bacterium GW2011_GWA1_36_9]KKS13775.1 MAG: hypothetical protein UU67_C0017G0010 [Candidatus Daviesbacteria bacterium GW2011_GWB1_41_5]OGE71384.1 MAG: hypothetical protein A2617_02325 [Candidatus Daviesbacteria bacterium RIFOXYD1_FULL_41_10]